MGLLAISSIYLKTEFKSFDSGKISTVLKSICTTMHETRKGRHWEVTYGAENPSLITIHVYKTEEYLWEIEEEMAQLGIDTAQFPEVITIVSAVGRPLDRDNCQVITDQISAIFDCLSINSELKS